MFNPPASLASRIAPTESCTRYGWPCQGPEMTMLRGVVHDPTARRMGGVAGHAGLFSTAADLAIFCRMLLGGGAFQGARILSPLAVEKMTSAASPDLETEHARPRLGHRFRRSRRTAASCCRSARSATPASPARRSGSIPPTGMFVVFLSNRVHPDGKGDVTPLRARVATVAAAAVTSLPPAARAGVWTGRDFGAVGRRRAAARRLPVHDRHRRPARARASRRCAASASAWSPTTPASRATARRRSMCSSARRTSSSSRSSAPSTASAAPSTTRSRRRPTRRPACRFYSLYGETRRPTAAMLDGLDALVIDLQDIGARFYTYTTTMAYVLEEAAKRRLPVVVLDRPNPINGFQIEGPALDKAQVGFTGLLRADADPARPDDRRAGAALQRREQDRRGSDRHRREELAARRVVRRDGAAVDQSVAEHAEPDSGDALSGHRRDRNDEHLGRARHRHAVRAGRRAVDRRDGARRGAQRAAHSGGQVLPGPLHARRPASTRGRSARACS